MPCACVLDLFDVLPPAARGLSCQQQDSTGHVGLIAEACVDGELGQRFPAIHGSPPGCSPSHLRPIGGRAQAIHLAESA